MNKLCFATTIGGMPIELRQNGIDRFTVRYWKQVKSELNYARAAAELGECIMHALACESKLDNGERKRADGAKHFEEMAALNLRPRA